MLMTPTSASRSSVMKSFIKRNTPLRVDPKVRGLVPRLSLARVGRRGWRLLDVPKAAKSSVCLGLGSCDLVLVKGQLRPLRPQAASTSGTCPDLLGSVLWPRVLAISA